MIGHGAWRVRAFLKLIMDMGRRGIGAVKDGCRWI